MVFAIWDTDSRNMLGTFDSEAAALRTIRDAADRIGAESIGALALVVEDEHGLSTTIAMGDNLLDRAHAFDAHSAHSH